MRYGNNQFYAEFIVFFRKLMVVIFCVERFFALQCVEDGFEQFRNRFRIAFRRIFEEELKRSNNLVGTQLTIAADMVASGVTYAYLDWLVGEFGDLTLEEMLSHFEETIARLVVA